MQERACIQVDFPPALTCLSFSLSLFLRTPAGSPVRLSDITGLARFEARLVTWYANSVLDRIVPSGFVSSRPTVTIVRVGTRCSAHVSPNQGQAYGPCLQHILQQPIVRFRIHEHLMFLLLALPT